MRAINPKQRCPALRHCSFVSLSRGCYPEVAYPTDTEIQIHIYTDRDTYIIQIEIDRDTDMHTEVAEE